MLYTDSALRVHLDGPMRRLWRQRRRLGISTLLCYLGWVQPVAPMVGGHLLLALFATLLCLGVFVGILIALPQWRTLIPRAGFAIFATISISWAWPTIYQFPSWALVFIGFVLLTLALGPVSRQRLQGTAATRATRVFEVNTPGMWRLVSPTEPLLYWDPDVREIRAVSHKPLILEIASESGHREIEIFDIDPPTHFKTRDLNGPGVMPGTVVVTSHVLEPHPRGTELTLIEGIWRPELGDIAGLWLDDYLGDHLDRMQAMIEDEPDWSIRSAMMRQNG